jgi:iron complex transport system ATP-binding protein
VNDFLLVRRLRCGYRDTEVLRGLEFSVRKGEILGVVGPNGSGKTTLLRALSRILKPLEGEVLLAGGDIWKITPRELARRLAVVSQIPESVSIPALDYVMLGRYPYQKGFSFYDAPGDRLIAERYMELTDTLRFRQKTLNELSGGERQLLQMARALTQEPELILADEPTAHLDIKRQITVMDLIKRLNRDLGVTIVLVMHDLNLASAYCDEILLLQEGKGGAFGPPDQVLIPRNIEAAYGMEVCVLNHPLSGKPCFFPIPGGMPPANGKNRYAGGRHE